MNAVMPSVAKEGQPPEEGQKNDCLCNHRSPRDAAPPLLSFHRLFPHEQAMFAHCLICFLQVLPLILPRPRSKQMFRFQFPQLHLVCFHWEIAALVPKELTDRHPHHFFPF